VCAANLSIITNSLATHAPATHMYSYSNALEVLSGNEAAGWLDRIDLIGVEVVVAHWVEAGKER